MTEKVTPRDLHPEFVWVSRQARSLRTQLRDIEMRDVYARGKNRRAQIKEQAVMLLLTCGTPPSLVELFFELLKETRGRRTMSWLERTRIDNNRIIAAQLEGARPLDPEGQRPSNMNHSEIGRELVKKLGDDAVHRTTILKWKDDPTYWELVSRYRPDDELD